MIINIITDFPEYFNNTFCSLFKRNIDKKIITINVIKIRNFTNNKHNRIDDTPFGGGGGMILKPDVIENVMNYIENQERQNVIDANDSNYKNYKTVKIITSPRGQKLNQKLCKKISKINELTIFCNRYEGVDQRAIDYYDLQEICVGDYILTGGETAAMCIIESVCRLLPDFIGNSECIESETFAKKKFIQSDHYTRPRIWKNLSVPDELLNGNHKQILEFKIKNSQEKKRQKKIIFKNITFSK